MAGKAAGGAQLAGGRVSQAQRRTHVSPSPSPSQLELARPVEVVNGARRGDCAVRFVQHGRRPRRLLLSRLSLTSGP
ncbi:hypothetical protein GUJ93_ZPchr0002g23753 [Zizania palustris]|uniref:Uncharacterized protein n=1 Tax=Zizania palustris TaxID=103762 RepID=A0A8J5VFN0_ZIZPA|nr:hypothetical protein GUJ93_ZPchr0002g23753 [Zizania palustris]